MKRNKKLMLGMGAIVLLALVIGGVLLRGKQAEVNLQQEQEYFSQPANLVGRWVSEEGGLSFLIYTSDVTYEPSYRIRMDIEQADFSGPSTIEGSVPANRAYIGYLEVLADQEERTVQLEIRPLRKLDSDNSRFEARVGYYRDGYLGECEVLGTFVFRKDTSFVTAETGEISQAATEAVMAALSQACNNYYYDAEVGVMDVEFDAPGTTGIYGEGVSYDGYLHGTGIIAPVSGDTFQTGTYQIQFVIDPAAEPLRVYHLENTTLGQTIVSEGLMQ